MSKGKSRTVRYVAQAEKVMLRLVGGNRRDWLFWQVSVLALVDMEACGREAYDVRCLESEDRTVRVWCSATVGVVTVFAIEVSSDGSYWFDPLSDK